MCISHESFPRAHSQPAGILRFRVAASLSEMQIRHRNGQTHVSWGGPSGMSQRLSRTTGGHWQDPASRGPSRANRAPLISSIQPRLFVPWPQLSFLKVPNRPSTKHRSTTFQPPAITPKSPSRLSCFLTPPPTASTVLSSVILPLHAATVAC